MAKSALQLKRALRSQSQLSASNVATLLDIYLSTGHGTLVRRLRALAYESGESSIRLWSLAEMDYYARRGIVPSLLSVFSHHFHLVGVPSTLFPLASHRRLRKSSVERFIRPSPLSALGHLPLLRRRISPERHHLFLLWRSIIRNIKRPSALVRRYREFVEIVVASRQIQPSLYPLPTLIPSPLIPYSRE